ncbi:DUF4184 family protein [Chitinophagaceae bacterium LB-8]|uniref:DUF4184 family protein n=1 Tax=Paraflavisolibacter caeni TaxID=2982496 RepID=A0A9X3BH54_9BACT|nr:DUF4184 family protein [Paraflavisolibacter caeni]MCU7548483.1 DUF4184 family protein [Paraflavisolibacter caeni]
MPFTFSHPAILLPFRKIGSVTALVVGSMVPDFQGFITLDVDKKFSHSWTGAILLDLPLALLCCYIFHGVVRMPLIDHLPRYFKSRFVLFYSFDWVGHVKENSGNVFFSLIAGIASHLLWDQLTHPGIIPGMEAEVEIFGISDPLFVFVQYACSIPPLILIFVVVHRLPVNDIVQEHSNKKLYWGLIALVSTIFTICRFMNCYHSEHFIDILINTSIAGLLAGLIISSIYCSLNKFKPESTVSTAV